MTILMYLPSFTSPVLFLTFSTVYIYDKIRGSGFLRGERKSRLTLWECIGKPKILCAALIPLSFTGLQMPNCEFSCSHQVCPPPSRKSSPSQLISLLAKTAEPQLVFNLMNFTSLSACKNYSNKPITYFHRKQGHLILLFLKSLAPADLANLFCSQVQPPCGPAWCEVSFSPRMWVHVTKKLLSISFVQCWVSCVWASYTV